MKLTDLANLMDVNTAVWITEDPEGYSGLYFGYLGGMGWKFMKEYAVVEIWPECYHALGNRSGISIHVRKLNQQEV